MLLVASLVFWFLIRADSNWNAVCFAFWYFPPFFVCIVDILRMLHASTSKYCSMLQFYFCGYKQNASREETQLFPQQSREKALIIRSVCSYMQSPVECQTYSDHHNPLFCFCAVFFGCCLFPPSAVCSGVVPHSLAGVWVIHVLFLVSLWEWANRENIFPSAG